MTSEGRLIDAVRQDGGDGSVDVQDAVLIHPLEPETGMPRGLPKPARGTSTWREFVAGPEHRLVFWALDELLRSAGNRWAPLVLCGPAGSGKTSLLKRLAAQWRSIHSNDGLIEISAASFVRDLALASRTKDLGPFRRHHRGASLLIIDALDHLAGKHPAQSELARTIDALRWTGAALVFAMREAPGTSAGWLPALSSRLTDGLCVPVPLPQVAARRAIIHRFAASRGWRVDDDAVEVLAAAIDQPANALCARLTQIALGNGKREPRSGPLVISAAMVRGDLDADRPVNRRRLQGIAQLVSRQFSVPIPVMRSTSRRQKAVLARGVTMLLAREHTSCTLVEIGRYFSGRDHTTVLHGCQRVKKLIEGDDQLRDVVRTLSRGLKDR